MQERDRVAYVGSDDPDLMLWNGQPGRVVATELYPSEVVVAFVNGPTLCLSPKDLAHLDVAVYAERSQRVLRLAHPLLEAVPIPQFWADLEPWPDDE